MLDGRYILTRIGNDLASDPIARNEPLGLNRQWFTKAYPGVKPEWLLIACHPTPTEGDEAKRVKALQAFLDLPDGAVVVALKRDEAEALRVSSREGPDGAPLAVELAARRKISDALEAV